MMTIRFYLPVLILMVYQTVVLSESVNEKDSLINTASDSIDNVQITDTFALQKKNDTLVTSDKQKDEHKDTLDGSIIVSKLSEIRRSFSTHLSKSRAQGYGGGAVITPTIIALQMKPVNELALHDNTLRKYQFSDLDDHYKALLTVGGIAFGGVGRGLRIGFGGWGGDISFSSEPRNDSVMLVSVHYKFGGLMIEKAFVKKNLNYLVGGMIGMGSLSVTRSLSDDAWREVDPDKDEKAEASFAGLSMHSGFTVTLLPWLHVGVDGTTVFMFSVNGFNISGCNGFSSIVPGIRMRIVLGNLG